MINFASYVIEQASRWPEKLAHRDGYEDLEYQELARRTKNLSASFADLGLRQGDHVIIAMEDCVDWPVIFLACLYCNVIPLPLATSMGPVLFRQIADFVGCQHVFSSDSIIETHRLDIPTTTRSQIRKLYSADTDMFPIMIHPDSPAWMNISSGSTGFPKVAVHRHQTLFEMLRMSPGPSFGMTKDSTILSTPKMSWNYGLQNSITYTLGLGATAIVIPEAPAAPTVFEYINRFRPDIVISSPSIIRRLLSPVGKKYTLPNSIKHFNSSGEHLPAPMYDQFLERFGLPLHSCIGMMETASNYAANSDWEHDRGTVGRAFDGVKIKLVDDEIYVSSPANACYYYNNYAKTRETFIGEWVRTGDRGYYNERGNLVFAGRVDDVFKVNDLIVNPIEIESTILKDATVDQVAVAGVPDTNGMIEVNAWIVPTESFDMKKFKESLKQQLFPHQMPRYIHTVNALPETMTNKKDRRILTKDNACY